MRRLSLPALLVLLAAALPVQADSDAERAEKLKQSQQVPIHETTGVPQTDYDAHMQRGMKEFSQQNFSMAGELFKKASQLKGDDWQSRYFHGLCQLYQGKNEEAEALGRESLAQKPNEYRSLVLLGLALKMQKKSDEAITHFTEAYKQRKDDPQLLEYIASTFFEMEKHDRALPFYFDALKLIPESNKPGQAKMAYNIALCYSFMAYHEEAEKHARTATTLDPSNVDYKKLLAEIEVLKAGGDPSQYAPTPAHP